LNFELAKRRTPLPPSFGIAVVGLDHWYIGLAAIDVFSKSSEFPLIGVADRHDWRREDVKSRGVQNVTEDFDALLNDDRVRVVFAMSNSASNEAISRRALEAGKDVLSVKPPAMTVEGVDQLVKVAEEKGRFFASFEAMNRFSARRRQIKSLIQDGAIGQPTTYCRLSQGGLPQPWAGRQGDSWWLDPAQVPGGAWIDHAIYAVDEVRDLFGTEIATAQAVIENRRYTDLKVEDYGIATMETTSHVTAVIEDAWLADHHAGVQTIIGREGSLHLSGPAAKDGPLLLRAGKPEVLPAAQDDEPIYVAFCRALQNGEVPFSGRDSRANLSACLAAYQSARERKRVEVG
jgi:predicted dehydrogenase